MSDAMSDEVVAPVLIIQCEKLNVCVITEVPVFTGMHTCREVKIKLQVISTFTYIHQVVQERITSGKASFQLH